MLKSLAYPISVQALLGCAVALVVGVAAMDDYGWGIDTGVQRYIAFANLYFMLAPEAYSLPEGSDRFYGVAFEIPLLLAEYAVSSDARHIILSRYLLTHLLFLAGALCCSLLTYRLFNNRLLAFMALLLFLLHPRLYASSFINSKDLSFLSMFMIFLHLTHKAFTKDTLGAFLILGVGVGVLVNLRVMGVVLLPAILTMRAAGSAARAKARNERDGSCSGHQLRFHSGRHKRIFRHFPLYLDGPARVVHVPIAGIFQTS